MSASAPGHPHPDDLLLWQAGELDGDAHAEVAAHVRGCPACRAAVERAEALMQDVAGLQLTAAGRPRVSPAVRRAAAAAVAIAFVFLAGRWINVTPTAQADDLIGKAVQHEPVASDAIIWRVTSGAARCDVRPAARQATASGLDAVSPATLCDTVSRGFRRVGWPPGELLSARHFQRWRASLASKRDAIARGADATEITTTTNAGPLRKAMIRLRTADHRLVAGRFEFAAAGPDPAGVLDVAEAPRDDPAPLFASPAPAAAEPRTTPAAAPASSSDLADVEVRLLLHALGLDTDVLVAVSRRGGVVEVWGVVPDDDVRTQLDAALRAIDGVVAAVGSGRDDGSGPRPVPWQAHTGDAAALAAGQVDALFAADRAARHAYLDGLDRSTRRLVGAARSHAQVTALARRLPHAPGGRLDGVLSSLRLAMAAERAEVARRLEPLLGETTTSGSAISEADAEELYSLVHDLVYLRSSSSPRTLESVSRRLAVLLR